MCDWPTALGERCDRSDNRKLGWTDIGLCWQHEEKLVAALMSDLHRDPFGEGNGFGYLALTAIERYAVKHPDAPFWGWIERMEAIRQVYEPAPDKPPSWVYFAVRENLVKIGVSRNVDRRLSELEGGGQMPAGMSAGPLRLLAAIPGTHTDEKKIHVRFEHLRVDPRREWFRPGRDLLRFIAQCRQGSDA